MSSRIVVQKYGGSSVATTESIRAIARKVVESRRDGDRVVVVVSAMGDSTDRLVNLAREVSPEPERRELDALLATGEQTTTALLSLAIRALGHEAISLTGAQCGIRTNGVYGNARIVAIAPRRVLEELERGRIVVAAGFQGVGPDHELTTLGRGGSDTTAVALAAALGADHCDIFTDVEGVYSADPRVVAVARPIDRMRHAEVEALGWHGARVLKAEAVEFARDNGIEIRVLSTFGGDHFTVVDTPGDGAGDGAWRPRKAAVAGVAGRKDLIRVGLDPAAGEELAGEVFAALASYDLVFGNLGFRDHASGLYLSSEEMPDADAFRADLERRFGAAVEVSPRLGAVSLVGFGIGSRPAALGAAYRTLRRHGLEVVDSFLVREALSFVVEIDRVDEGLRALHHDFVEHPEPAPAAGAEAKEEAHGRLRANRV